MGKLCLYIRITVNAFLTVPSKYTPPLARVGDSLRYNDMSGLTSATATAPSFRSTQQPHLPISRGKY